MASESCHQAQQGHSFSEKVTEVGSWAVESHGSQKGYSQTECFSETQTQQTNQGTDETQIQFYHSKTQADHPKHGHGHHQPRHGMTKKRGEHKKGLFHRIKDKISGDSSSSDSESDDEKCGRGKSY